MPDTSGPLRSPPAAWVAPDARADESPVVVVAVGGHPPAPHVQAGRGWEVPVPLRPFSIADRLDGSLRILKLAPATVLTLAAVAVVPVQLVIALSLRGASPADGFEQFDAVFGRALLTILSDGRGELVVVGILLVLLETLSVSLVAAGLTVLVAGWYTGQPPTTTEVLTAAVSRLPALVGAWVLVHLAEAACGVVLLVPALVPMTLFAVAAPVVASERLGAWRALRRSSQLTRRAFPLVLGTCLLVAVVDFLLRFSLTAIGVVYASSGGPAGWVVAAVVGLAARLVTVPFVAGTAALLYLDLRVRLEGLDIELAAADRSFDGR